MHKCDTNKACCGYRTTRFISTIRKRKCDIKEGFLMAKLMMGICAFLCVALFMDLSLVARADDTVILVDDADLFTSEQEKQLKEQMLPMVSYGNVALITNVAAYNGEANKFAEQLCHEYFPNGSGVVFLIDMYQRRIEFRAIGSMRQNVTNSRASGIADNIYTYASDGNYYECAQKGLEQLQIILEGGHLSVPMRYVSNFFFAASISLLIVFGAVYLDRTKWNMGKAVDNLEKNIPDGQKSAPNVIIVSKKKTKETRVSNSSSSGSSGGGGGGGGSSGGGHGF